MLLHRRLAALLCVWLIPAATGFGAEPSIRNIDIRGLRIGGTTRLTIDGAELLPNPRVVSSLNITKQQLQPKPTAGRIVVDVELAKDVIPGLYTLRIGNDNGVSASVVVAVDHLAQMPIVAENEFNELPVAAHGIVSGSGIVDVKFVARAKQRVMCEVEANRLGGQLRPVLHLHDPQGRHIRWAMPQPSMLGDTRIIAELPVAGTYTLKLHDLQYAAPAANYFRLKIGQWDSADAVFPPAVTRGTPSDVLLVGAANGLESNETRVSISTADRSTASNDLIPAPWSKPNLASGPRLAILVSDIPELVEAQDSQQPQPVSAIPSAISGRLLQPNEQDKYRIAVKAGSKLKFEVFAQRILSPIDASLEIQNDKGGRLAFNDDAAGSSDPALAYTVPKGVEAVFVVVSDTAGTSGSNCIYRLVVTDSGNKSSKPDFDVTLSTDRAAVAAGGSLLLKAEVTRRGYVGAVELGFEQFPKGVAFSGNRIAAGEDASLVIVTGLEKAIVSQLVTRIHATALDSPIAGTKKLVTIKGHPLKDFQPWMQQEMALAVSTPAKINFKTRWSKVPPEFKLTLGGKIKLPLNAVRPIGFDGPVRLTLMTSQKQPLVNNNPDVNRTLRQETANFEIPPDKAAQTTFDAKVAAEKAVATLTQQQTTALDTAKKKLTVDETALKAAVAEAAKTVAALVPIQKQLKSVKDELAAHAKQTASLQDKIKAGDVPKADVKKRLDEAAAEKKVLDTQAAQIDTQRKAVVAKITVAQAKVKQVEQLANASKVAIEKTQADFGAKLKAASGKLLDAMKKAEAASAAAKNIGEVSVIVPPSLGDRSTNLAFKAELLSRDKRQVLGTVYTEVRKFETLNPFALKLTGATKIVQTLDTKKGTTVTLTGTLERRVEFKQDVTVTLEGLPPGIAVPKVVLKADKVDFKLDIKFPANQKPADVGPIKLFATGKLIASNPIVNRTDDINVSIQLKQPPVVKPAAKQR